MQKYKYERKWNISVRTARDILCSRIHFRGRINNSAKNANSGETVSYYTSLVNGKYNFKTGKRGIVMSKTIYLVIGATGFPGNRLPPIVFPGTRC